MDPRGKEGGRRGGKEGRRRGGKEGGRRGGKEGGRREGGREGSVGERPTLQDGTCTGVVAGLQQKCKEQNHKNNGHAHL